MALAWLNQKEDKRAKYSCLLFAVLFTRWPPGIAFDTRTSEGEIMIQCQIQSRSEVRESCYGSCVVVDFKVFRSNSAQTPCRVMPLLTGQSPPPKCCLQRCCHSVCVKPRRTENPMGWTVWCHIAGFFQSNKVGLWEGKHTKNIHMGPDGIALAQKIELGNNCEQSPHLRSLQGAPHVSRFQHFPQVTVTAKTFVPVAARKSARPNTSRH